MVNFGLLKKSFDDELNDVHLFILDCAAFAHNVSRDIIEHALRKMNPDHLVDKFIEAKNPLLSLVIALSKGVDSYIGITPDRIIFTDAAHLADNPSCLLFVDLLHDGPITPQNMKTRIASRYICHIDFGIKHFYETIDELFLPAIKAQTEEMGSLLLNQKKYFITEIYSYLQSLKSVAACVNENVKLSICRDLEMDILNDKSRCLEAAHNLRQLGSLEECVCRWMRQISLEIQEVDMVREELSNSGPHTEIRFWKQRTARFNCLINQLNLTEVSNALLALKAARSKTMTTWQELDHRVTSTYNESLQNAKFLQVIMKQCQPLYEHRINEMKANMTHLIMNLRMIYNYSSYYRSFSNMSILFVKITNQMITSCTMYIEDCGNNPIWSQSLDALAKRLNECIELNKAYQKAYHEVRKIHEEGQNELCFSEIQIFGDFNEFVTRIEAILHIIAMLNKYGVLQNIFFEGKNKIYDHYKKLKEFITTNNYDYLSLQNTQFNKDFVYFGSEIESLQENITNAYNQQCARGGSSLINLKIMMRMEDQKVPSLGQDGRYRKLFGFFRSELEDVAALYWATSNNPPADRDMPPYAARIAWARNLYLRLAEPMSIFWRQMPTIRDSKDGIKTVQRFNRICEALVAFEILVFHAWKSTILEQTSNLHSSILVQTTRGTKTIYLVNLDENVRALFRELICLNRLGCPIPRLGLEVGRRAIHLKKRILIVKDMLGLLNSTMKMIPESIEKLLVLQVYKIHEALAPGLFLHNWNSSRTDVWVEGVMDKLHKLRDVLGDAKDIRELRIEVLLKKLIAYRLIILPEQPENEYTFFLHTTSALLKQSEEAMRYANRREPGIGWALKDLISLIQDKTGIAAQEMQDLSNAIYDATSDYVNLLVADFDQFVKNFVSYNTGGQEHWVSQTEMDPEEYDHMRRRSTAANSMLKNEGGSDKTMMMSRTRKIITKTLQAVEETMRLMGQRTLDAIIKSVRGSLEDLWRPFGLKKASSVMKDVKVGKIIKLKNVKPFAVIRCEIVLNEFELSLKPTLDEIQAGIRTIINLVFNATKSIGKWTEKGRNREIVEKNIEAQFSKKANESILIGAADASTMNDLGTKLERSSTINEQASLFKLSNNDKLSQFSEISTSLNAENMFTSSTRNSITSMLKMDRSLSKVTINSLMPVDINCYADVRHDREVYRTQTMLMSWLTTMKRITFLPNDQMQEIKNVIEPFQKFYSLWATSSEEQMKIFLNDAPKPNIVNFETKFMELNLIEHELVDIYDIYYVGPLEIHTSSFKYIALKQLRKHQQIFLDKSIETLINPIFNEMAQLDELERVLGKPMTNLDDISSVMEAVAKFRFDEVTIDLHITRAEELVTLLAHYEPKPSLDLLDRIEMARMGFSRAEDHVREVMEGIIKTERVYRDRLIATTQETSKEIYDFISDFHKKGPMELGISQTEAFDRLRLFRSNYDQKLKKAESCRRGQALFDLPLLNISNLRAVGRQMELFHRLYVLYSDSFRMVNGFEDLPWKDVDMAEIEVNLLSLQSKCRKLPSALKNWAAFIELEETLSSLVGKMPLLQMLRDPSMKSRHWQTISDITKKPHLDPELNDVMVSNMIRLPIGPKEGPTREEVEEVCVGAARENEIELKLQRVHNDWANQDLALSAFKARGDLLLKGDRTMEIQSLIEDSLLTLTSLSNNRFNKPFKSKISNWMNALTTVNEVMDFWMRVQSLWVYLEAVFVGGDIAKQMPQEARRFQSVDKNWVRVMDRAKDTPSVVTCCTIDSTLQEMLPRMLDQLEICQRSLSGYLEGKRRLFPRFFFVSDPVLLEILGQASTPEAITTHLLTIFDSIDHLQFNESVTRIEKCFSAENEELVLHSGVECTGPVETWLTLLLTVSKESVLDRINLCYIQMFDVELDLLTFLEQEPSQLGILAVQLIWTHDASDALKGCKDNPKMMQETSHNFLSLLELLISQTTKDLTATMRTKFETLITIHLHQKDIFDGILKQGIKSINDFEWMKQTRVYFLEDLIVCMVSITNVNFSYQNEFLGCTERLVITPLTDRCYITLAQALNMSFGGAPAGPAGTGKTETTKDMGRCLGQYVVVFNCSDQMDFRGLGRIFKGLAQSGCWGCFDEFNRIDLAVLSVAAQQIAIVLFAKRDNKNEFVFSDGDVVNLDPEFGIFITMNPGYAGRQELPENLKINFRTVAMMVPDRFIIIRVKMASCGFIENLPLSKKFYVLYGLCEEQLSKQVHYDFGLRNILSVLRTFGSVRRSNPDESEEKIVMHVLRDMNLSKLVDQDEPLFLSILKDLFPGVYISKESRYPELESGLQTNCNDMGLIAHKPWMLKVVQLYETQNVRHGMMVLGPSGSGKTKCIGLLMNALSEIDQSRRELRMNPKAITAPQMFGKLDPATNDWTDGIFSTLWRRTTKMKRNEHYWLILDGPVDAIWIENLNSVLDDNKTLTLANGDRIPMAPRCKIIFEVDNVDNASPATISRNGMIYMSSNALNWEPIFKKWIQSRPIEEHSQLIDLANLIIPPVLKLVVQELSVSMHYLEAFYIIQLGYVFNAVCLSSDFLKSARVETVFIFSLIWSFGALLDLDQRERFDTSIRQIRRSPKLQLPPTEDRGRRMTVFDYRMTVDEDDSIWVPWSNFVDNYEYPETGPVDFEKVLVPNQENVVTEFLLTKIAKTGRSVLLFGEPGTAKTAVIKKYLSTFKQETQLARIYNFSSVTTPYSFQMALEGFVEKRVGFTFGPPVGKKLVVFIDDISMPIVNEWGDQVANEIVRQTMETGGFYSLEKPGEFVSVVDVQFVAAMCTPGGGRNDIPMRLKRQFCVFVCNLPGQESMDHIFCTIALGHFSLQRGFTNEIREMVQKLVPVTRIVWHHIKGKMLPTPTQFHYIFNLRDLSRIWQGMAFAISEVFMNTETLLLLWKNEVTRVLADKLTDLNDKTWFTSSLTRIVFEEINAAASELMKRKCSFCHFMRDSSMEDDLKDDDELLNESALVEDEDIDAIPRIYDPVYEIDVIRTRCEEFLSKMNEESRGLPLKYVFFTNAIGHVIRVCRATHFNRGSVLLVGVGGSGKQTIVMLATYVSGYHLYTINTSSLYNVSNFLDDLKLLYRKAGTLGTGVVFLFGDKNIKDEIFLDYINNILMGGMVTSFFLREELEEIGNSLVNVYRRIHRGKPFELPQLIDFFLERARQHVHIALCFSPIGVKFRSRALAFPGLIAGCTIDWFLPWPRDALIACGRFIMTDFPPCLNDEQLLLKCVDAVSSMHIYAEKACVDYFKIARRTNHVTPKTFFSFLSAIKSIYSTKIVELNENVKRMDTGVQKLVEAKISIFDLQIELTAKEADLKVANAESEKVLSKVLVESQAAEIVKSKVEMKKLRCERIVKNIEMDRKKAEAELKVAKPALEEAEEALNTIKSADIATVRKLAKPPNLIMRIMDCVCILFYNKLEPISMEPDKDMFGTSWKYAIRFMSNPLFLSHLLEFPKYILTEEMMDFLEPYMTAPDYNTAAAKKSCGNVAGLLAWTTAMYKFFWVNKVVVPLQDNLVAAQQHLEKANIELQVAEAVLFEKTGILNAVQFEYDSAMLKKQRLKDDADLCLRRMMTANQLIDGLGGEMGRWKEQSNVFKMMAVKLTGDSISIAHFLLYAGGFNQHFRVNLIGSAYKTLIQFNVPHSHDLDLIKTMVTPTTINEWNVQGLPLDNLSLQNAVIATCKLRYPLLVDPQAQAKKWLGNYYANSFLVTSMTNKSFKAHVEEALNNGLTLFIEGIGEELDPGLENVLSKSFKKIGTSLQVTCWDFETTVNPNFQMFISTQLFNPVCSPELLASATLIDFNVTVKGLEDQLLARVITLEREKLEKSRIELLTSMVENKKRVEQLEINLLYRLNNTQGFLVDDLELLEVLQKTKTTAEEVMHQLELATETEVEINKVREEYRPVAQRGALIYFLIQDMARINHMYQSGLRQFMVLFDDSLESSEKDINTRRRISYILKFMLMRMWKFNTRALYKRDSVMFTLSLAIRIELQNKHIRPEEVEVFIKGGSALSLPACPPKPTKWIPDITWLNINGASKLRAFSSIVDQVITGEKRWKRWYDTESPEDEVLPFGYDTDLSSFNRLILIRTWCPDRVVRQAKKYISDSIGHQFSEDNRLSLEETYTDSRALSPILNLLTTGADPTLLIEQYAKRMKTELNFVSMGQGQEVHARYYIKEAMLNGSWVLLQNCHLALNYVQEVFTLLSETVTQEEIAAERLVELTTSSSFSSSVSSTNSELLLSAAPPKETQAPILNMHALPSAPKQTTIAHDGFRLWVTTEENTNFPVAFLQISIKFTNQPPEGLRSGLSKTYTDISQDFLDACVSMQWKVVLFAVTFLHRTLEERRKFTPIGWSVPYEFNQADYNASIEFMRAHIDEIEFAKKNIKNSGIDWKCVRYILSEIQFGGRITDPDDIVIMITLVKRMFVERMFQEDFEIAPGYIIPRLSTVNQYLGFINSLPLQESPESVHLNVNAEIEYSTRFTENMIDSIQMITDLNISEEINSNDGAQKTSTKENQTKKLCQVMLDKMPAIYSKYTVIDRLEVLGNLKPIVIFLRQEIQQMIKLLEVTHLVLSNLIKAINGKIIMNANLREAMDAIYNAKVPSVFLRYSWQSSTLGFWFTELIDRNTQLSSWIFQKPPLSYWLSGFFNPLGLLTSVRQDASRNHLGWSLEYVNLATNVTKFTVDELPDSAKEGIFIHGLCIQAGSWDKRSGRIVEAKPKQIFDVMPVINVTAMCELSSEDLNRRKGSVEAQENNHGAFRAPANMQMVVVPSVVIKLNVPVYKKVQRTGEHFITKFKIPCSKTPDHWIMRGVALLCDTH